MRQKRVVLKDHRQLVAPKIAQLLRRIRQDVVPFEQHAPARRLDEPDEAADERRLAAPRQPHHHEHLPDVHAERDVAQADHQPQLVLNLGAALVGVFGLENAVGVLAKHLPEVFDFDAGVGTAHFAHLSDTPRVNTCQSVRLSPAGTFSSPKWFRVLTA